MDITGFATNFRKVASNIEQVIHGKPEQVELALVCLFAKGHLLIEDTPGLGKTKLAKALANSIHSEVRRIQFTPDLLPTDITTRTVYDREARTYRFERGPVFANVVIADEINRASPKTQSALLEVMEEQQVSLGGETEPVPDPFIVLATQNPLDTAGTYALPEAQLDRFLMRISMGYPDLDDELAILQEDSQAPAAPSMPLVPPVLGAPDVVAMAKLARARVLITSPLSRYIAEITRMTRVIADDGGRGVDGAAARIAVGASPRGTVALARAARVYAASRERDYVRPEDVAELAVPVLAHRLVLAQGVDQTHVSEEAVAQVLRMVPPPR
ncbi:AAA family ATPase [Pseudofrankia asymbiotica]|uniref:ATPase n=1 Tax=Pseudofrankia asymbiotica TaxID=1834516 RepID=A0A1V2I1V7_9ACTN|nr:AAA family ATPase [Pseudofrankia asymbiotica]ONH22361.1 hypothetical protein BL253_35915 [Pseudofrankia asymbiotica]